MKIAFWNLGGMGISSKKQEVCTHWIQNNSPDLLIFEEISSSMKEVAQLHELTKQRWISTLDINNNEGTKDLAIFARASIRAGTTCATHDAPVPAWRLVTDEIELPFFEAVREEREARSLVVNPCRRRVAMVSVEIDGGYLSVYGLHANSSYSGGMTAVTAMNKMIAHFQESRAKAEKDYPRPGPRQEVIAGGDFNHDAGDLSPGLTKKIEPMAYDGKVLSFTQWRKEIAPAMYKKASYDFSEGEYGKYCSALHLPQDALNAWTLCVLPGRQLDYVLTSAGLQIKALPNCSSGEEWLNILKEFDHAPVLYDV